MRHSTRLLAALLLLVSVLGTARPGASATFYVAKTGNNGNPGTTTLPKLTIIAGAALLGPGDTLIVRAGEYIERLHDVVPGGTSWATNAKVTVKAEVAGTVTIKPPSGSGDLFGWWFSGTDTKYIEIDGFVIDGDGPGEALWGVLINNEAHHIRIQNTEIKNTMSNGIFVSAGEFPGTTRSCCNEFINLNVHHTARSAVLGVSGGGHGIYCSTSDNIIEWSHWHDNPGYGIQIYSSYGGVRRNIARYNRINNNNTKKNAAGMVIGSGDGNQAYGNLIYDNAGGILFGGGTLIYNNTIVGNKISPGSDSDIALIVNGGGTVINNIIWDHPTNFAGTACPDGCSATGCTCITHHHNSFVNPQFVNLAGKDFRLTASSPARNAGVNLAQVTEDLLHVPRPQGSTTDIGAYEYNEGAVTPPLVLTITSPVSTPTLSVSDAVLASVSGNASGPNPITSVTWTCPTCTPASGTASGTTSWTLGPLELSSGANLLTVSTTSGPTTVSDTLTVTLTLTPTVSPVTVLDLHHTCATSNNALRAGVDGSLFYLPAETSTEATALAQSQCASQVTLTENASVLGGGMPTVKPWQFLGTAGPNTTNVCTNCLSVHNSAASLNAAGSGYTLSTFREGASLTAATGGVSPFTLLPSLCTQVVGGEITPTPLWPWPMDLRIQQARSLAGASAVNVTDTVQGLLGTIPAACLSTPPVEATTTWFIAPTSASPPGVDGAACTLAAPCATLAHVAGRMGSAPNQTIYLRGGTYAQRITSGMFPPSTSWSAPTTIAAYGMESVVLQMNTGRLLDFANPVRDRFLLLDGLTIDGMASTSTTTNGLVVNNAGPIRFQNGTIRHTHFERVLVTNGSGIEVLNSTIQGGTLLPAVRVRGTTNGFILQGNTMHGGPSHGVEVPSGTLTNARIQRNSIQGHTAGTCVILSVGNGTVVDNNVLADCAAGLVIEEAARDTLVRYNTIADHSSSGLVIEAGVSGTVITNTIVARSPVTIANGGTGTAQTTNLETDPGFVGSGDYHLALASSPAADEGTCLPGVVDVALDGVVRPQPVGGACDIGAYEREGDGDPPLPTPGPLSARPWGSRMLLLPH